MTKNNISISFCGIDGCGKSTQLKKVGISLEKQGLLVMPTKLDYSPLEKYDASKSCENVYKQVEYSFMKKLGQKL